MPTYALFIAIDGKWKLLMADDNLDNLKREMDYQVDSLGHTAQIFQRIYSKEVITR